MSEKPPGPMSVIRYADGQVDDVAIAGDLFRLEQMDKTRWWLAIYRNHRRTAFQLSWDSRKRAIVATVIEDEIGCGDDSNDE